MKKFGKIGQFRDTVKTIRHIARYERTDENGEVVYNNNAFPILEFTGTVKLHGTNGGIWYKNGKVTALSRRNLLTLQNDNYGFAAWVRRNSDYLEQLLSSYSEAVLYGEWVGEGIQSGVAISQIEKAFFAFELRDYSLLDEGMPQRFAASCPDIRLFNIYHYPTYKTEIDFNYPELSIPLLTEITQQVESQCPIGFEFGIDGTGEGVVWSTIYKDQMFRFKVKGEKHSVTKVKKLVAVNPEKVSSVKEFVESVVTENRINQAMQETKADSVEKTGDLLRWIANDIIEEEGDVLVESNLVWKDVASAIANKARTIFFEKINSQS